MKLLQFVPLTLSFWQNQYQLIFIFDFELIIYNLKIFAMDKAIKLKVRKELDARQQLNIIKLKGSLISKGYTEIIHILDQDEDFHINSFETPSETNNEVQEFIKAFITKEDLTDTVALFK